MQNTASLFITEAALSTMATAVYAMMFTYCMIMSIGEKARLYMKLKPENSGVVDLANHFNAGRHTRHVDVRLN